MKLHYFKSRSPDAPGGDFGDELNPWLWPRLLGPHLEDPRAETAHLVGIGTILNDDTVPDTGHLAVLGSGAGYGRPPVPGRRWRFFCVRGPLTAEQLGLDPKYAVTDGALLLRSIVDAAPRDRSQRPCFMPHYQSDRAGLRDVADEADVDFIDPTAGVEPVLIKISRAKLLIAEAMHGAIVADALRVPSIPARTWPGINQTKWRDWLLSMRVDAPFSDLFFRRISLGARRSSVENPVLRALAHRLAVRRLRHLATSGLERLSDNARF